MSTQQWTSDISGPRANCVRVRIDVQYPRPWDGRHQNPCSRAYIYRQSPTTRDGSSAETRE